MTEDEKAWADRVAREASSLVRMDGTPQEQVDRVFARIDKAEGEYAEHFKRPVPSTVMAYIHGTYMALGDGA